MMDVETCLHPTPNLPLMFKNQFRALGCFNIALMIHKSLFQNRYEFWSQPFVHTLKPNPTRNPHT